MTMIIIRLYKSSDAADSAASKLRSAGFADKFIDVITHNRAARDERTLEELMSEAGLGKAAIAACSKALAKGQALLVARPPFGSMLEAAAIVDTVESIPVEGTESRGVADYETRIALLPTILRDHPRFLSQDLDSRPNHSYGTVSDAFGLRLLSKPRQRMSAARRTGHVSTRYLRFPLLTSGPISTRFLRYPLLLKRARKMSVMPDDGMRFSSIIGWPLLSKRR